jgi:hypothetical protein
MQHRTSRTTTRIRASRRLKNLTTVELFGIEHSKDKKEIENHLKNAADQLFLNQPTIYHFTPETRKTEWNLAHHLAIETHKLFPTFDYDLELTKHPANNRRPDIVLHERGCHSRNFLVIEIKATDDLRDTICDTRKIERHWLPRPRPITTNLVQL